MATHLEQTKQFLDAGAEYKDTHLSDILGLVNDLMVNWKQAIAKGSKEEQAEAIKRINQVRGLLKDYFEKMREELHINAEEVEQLVEYAMKKDTPNREKIVHFCQEFEKHSEEIVGMVGKKEKRVKRRAPRASWIQS